MSETQKKQVSPEFVNAVRKYLEVDNKLREYKEKSKNLNVEKKEQEEFILKYLTAVKEEVVDVADGKLKRSITKTQAPLKKEYIQKTLTEIFNDMNKATIITDKLINGRPIIEKVSLRRTRTKNDD